MMLVPDPREEVRGKINSIQQAEAANNSDDDVATDILNVARFGAAGLVSRTLRVGSTTQGSGRNDDGRSNVRVSIVAEYDADGMLQFNARTLPDAGRTATIRTTDQDATVTRLEARDTNWKGVELKSETNTWYHYADLFSDIENDSDTDYLAMGYWLFERKERSTTSTNYHLFVAAGGSDPFESANVAGLTGTATYEGFATGLHMTKENATAIAAFDYFNAKATLTADFGDATGVGSVSGAITEGMTAGGEAVPELTLETAAITSGGRDFWGMTSGGNGLTGAWGGKFYSDGAAATDYPGATAGTFGAKTADDLNSFIGAFAAYGN